MEVITILLLLVLGVVLLIVEFMLIPGITVAGIASVLAFGTSIFFAFSYWGTLGGIITLVAIIIFIPVFLYFLFKGKAMTPMMLNSGIDGKVISFDNEKIKIGDEGITSGRLAPMGNIKVNGLTIEARSRGIFIDPKTKIKIVKIEGNTVIVEPINS
jgi:membrane protein implicated in regulation of membrane protease activity